MFWPRFDGTDLNGALAGTSARRGILALSYGLTVTTTEEEIVLDPLEL